MTNPNKEILAVSIDSQNTERSILIEKHEYTMWIENGILVARFGKNVVVTELVMKSAVDDRLRMCEGETYPLLIDGTSMKYTTRKAMDYTNQPLTQEGISAFALLTENPVIQVLGNFYMKYVQKPPRPSKIFTSRTQATEFLKQFKSA